MYSSIPLIEATCTVCKEHVSLAVHRDDPVCSACEFVEETLQAVAFHCGQVTFPKYRLWVVPDTIDRFARRGWKIELLSGNNWAGGTITLAVSNFDGSTCKGKPLTPKCCYDSVPSVDEVMSARHAGCGSKCADCRKVVTIDGGTLALKCARAVAGYELEPLTVVIDTQELPALLTVIADLKSKDWSARIDGTFNRRPFAQLVIQPATK